MNTKSVLLCAAVAMCLCAQDPRGAIRGRIVEASGGVVPNVEVRATNAATGVTASGRSNAAGNYAVPFLIPGTYTITAEQTGFKKFMREGIQVSDVVELNIQMELGAVSETVEVTAEAPLLDTSTPSIGQVLDERRITELPAACRKRLRTGAAHAGRGQWGQPPRPQTGVQ